MDESFIGSFSILPDNLVTLHYSFYVLASMICKAASFLQFLFELTKRKAVPLPPEQDLFIEFTKPIYSEVTQNLNRFFRKYN